MNKIIFFFCALLISSSGFAQKKGKETTSTSEKPAKEGIIIKGHVLHIDTYEPIAAKLFYYDLGAHTELGSSTSDPHDGHFQLLVHKGHHYGLAAELKGYLPVFEELHLIGELDVEEIERNVYLAPLKVGEIVPLTNVHFTPDGKKLKPMSYMALDHLVQVLKEHPNMHIEIKGLEHFGKAGYTEEHALKSALAIKKYLKKKGISKDRVTCSAVKDTELHTPSDLQEIFEVELLIKKM